MTGHTEFDVIVIGAGPAGETAAGRCADAGLSVAIVERELVGGECSYWGCIPSKTLVRPGDVVAAARRVAGAREAVRGPIDVTAALARRDELTSNWDDTGALRWLEEKHITLVRGAGRLDGARRVVVGDRVLAARRAVVLATGTAAVIPPIPGLADARPWDNRDATAAREIPRRLLVLGGGAMGVELAQAFRRLGAEQVTVIEAAERLLAREEPFAADEVREAFTREGIEVVTGHAMTSAARVWGGPGTRQPRRRRRIRG
jgi:pyruvate/2-oxoglutarate dehydrogenase complex dihydrolipoamide dehydrogenase (E3) component